MPNYLQYGVVGLLVVVAILQLLALLRKDNPLRQSVASLEESEQALRTELATVLSEARTFHEEVSEKFSALMKLMVPASTVTKKIDEKLDRVREVVEQKLDKAGENVLAVANGQRQDNLSAVEEVKKSILSLLDQYTQYQNRTFAESLEGNANNQRTQLASIVENLTRLIEANDQKLAAHRMEVDARMKRIQSEIAVVAKFQSATRAFGATLATEFSTPTGGNGLTSR
jgi:hypothetical protein